MLMNPFYPFYAPERSRITPPTWSSTITTKTKETKVNKAKEATLKLRECPFCGDVPVGVEAGDALHSGVSMKCLRCGTIGPKDTNLYKAVERWNSRWLEGVSV